MSKVIEETSQGPAQRVWRTLVRDRLAMVSLMVLVLMTLVALTGKVFTEWVVVFDPGAVRLVDKLRPPFSSASALVPAADQPPLGVYLLGTDDLGRDVFARMLQGAFVSLSIGIVAVAISLLIGVTLGAVAGYYGERRVGLVTVDGLIMRFTDVMLSFPSFFLVLTVVALLPASIYNIMVVIGLTGWMTMARLVRAECLALRERDFVMAAIAGGLPEWRVIVVHMLPNTMALVIVSAVISVASAILTESALSFLGFGVQPPNATFGNILAGARDYVFDAPWLFFIPGTAILLVVLAFNLLGEGLREALHPQFRLGD